MARVAHGPELVAQHAVIFRSLAYLRLADLDDDADVLNAVRSCLDCLRLKNCITGYSNCKVLHENGSSWVVVDVSWNHGFLATTFRFLKGLLVPEMIDVMEVMES